MSDYTPTTEEVRIATTAFVGSFIRKDEFDRWLTDVKAEAWDECGRGFMGDAYGDSETYLRNPYRGENK